MDDSCSELARPKSCRRTCLDSARASALAAVDRRYNNNALIVADLSNDATYAEILLETFGPRVIGMQISRHGDGMNLRRGRPNMAICRFTPSAEAICSNCSTPNFNLIWSELPTRRQFAAPMSNWPIWRSRIAKAEPSTPARRENTTTSASPAPCWPGRRSIRTCHIGSEISRPHAGRAGRGKLLRLGSVYIRMSEERMKTSRAAHNDFFNGTLPRSPVK